MEKEVDRAVDKKETKPCTCKAADFGVFLDAVCLA